MKLRPQTRARARLFRRPPSYRPRFDILEDRVSLGDAILGAALGLTALASAKSAAGDQAPAALSQTNLTPPWQAEDAPDQASNSPRYYSATSQAPDTGVSRGNDAVKPPAASDDGGSEPFAGPTSDSQGARFGGGSSADNLFGTPVNGAFSFSSSGAAANGTANGGAAASHEGPGAATTQLASGLGTGTPAGNNDGGGVNAGNNNGGASAAPAAPHEKNGGITQNGGGIIQAAGAADLPPGDGGGNNGVKGGGNNGVTGDDRAAELRRLLSYGNKYRPGEPGEEADLDQRVADILQSQGLQNPAANNALPGNSVLTSNGASFEVSAAGGADPGAPGTFQVTSQEYNFGDQVFDPVSIAGTARVELTASVYSPTVLDGQRPVLVFLHGNHSATYNPTTGQAFFEWPPGPGRISLPNYRGYEYVARNLASHGYVVVSVSANGVNVLGGINMVPRAELMHRHLQILRDLTTTGTVTGDGIVDDPSTPQDETRPFGDRFVGHLDLTNIGTMGHSRGGDGVVAHFQYETGVNLGSGLPVLPESERFPIKAVLPLAPVDFTARTINNVPLMVILPYNDGDVSDLQGQRFYDRARYNVAGDTAPKHVILVQGASHNSYNTVWFAEPEIRFPAGAFDDGAGAPRLTPQEQRSTALAYFGAFFQTYVGNAVQPVQPQFFRNLTGDLPVPPSVITPANPVLAGGIFYQFHPADNANSRRDVNRLLNAAALTTNQLGGAVTSSGITAAFSTAGLQGVGSASLTWASSGGFWENAIPAAQADVSRYSHLQFRVSNQSTVLQNFSVVLTDGAGNSASTTVNAQYTDPSPARRTPLYNRTAITPTRNVLNTAAIPLSAFSGVNLTDVRSIRFVFDQTSSGQVLVNDLMFANHSLGFQVSGTTPGQGDIVTAAPTSFEVRLSDPYDPASVDASDLTVNGVAADAVEQTSPTTLTFTYATSPVTAQGVQTISLAAGALTRQLDGEALGAFTATFRFDEVRLQVVSTDPAAGSGVALPFTQLDVTFNEPIDPASAGTNDLTLSQGAVTAATVLAGNQAVRYTLSGITTEGTLTVTIAAGALTDVFGNPGLAFTGTYFLDIGTVAFPALRPENPLGSLVYSGSAAGLIAPADDTDSFTLDVAAGQTIAVVVRPTSASLRPGVELRDASGTVVGSNTAAAANGEAYLQAVPSGDGGQFTITVSGAAGTTGNYTVRVILNAALEDEAHGGPANDTPATAQDLKPSFLGLTGDAQRAAVLGQTGGLSEASPIWAGIPNPLSLTQDTTIGTSTVGLLAAGTGQSIGRYANGDDAVIVGNGGRTILNGFMPYLATSAPARVQLAQNEINFVLTGVTGPRVLYFSDVSPAGVADPYLQALTNLGITPTVVPQSSTTAPDTYPQFVTQLQTGTWDLVVFQQRFWSDGGIAFGWITPLVTHINSGGRAIFSSWARTNIFPPMAAAYTAFGGSTTGAANQLVVNQAGSFTPLPDYYSFTLSAGQTVTLALQAAGGTNVEIRDASDTALALGRAGPTNLSRVISNFVAPAAGTYYARVIGQQPGVDYTLVVTRNADFNTEPNNEFLARSAQPLGPAVGGVQAALGHVTGGAATAGARVLYFLDVGPAGDDPYLQAFTSLGITPTVVPQSSTDAPTTYPQFVTQLSAGGWDLVIFQQRFWFSDTVVTPIVNYVNGGGRMIWGTWNRTQVFPAMAPVFTAFGGGTTGGANQTVVNQTVSSPIWDGIPDPLNLTLDGTIGVTTLGLTATTGQAIGRYANGDAALVVGNDGRTVLNGFPAYTATDVASRQRLAENEVRFLLSASDPDVYQVRASAGQVVQISTSTPLSGNTLDPAVRVYGPDGELAAEDDNSAADGRNASLSFTAPEDGLYFIEVRASGATPAPTSGEYVLTVGGAESGQSFEVVSTTPADRARLITAPTTLTVTFNTNVLLTSLNASDLTVDGVPATAFTVLDGGRVQFTLPGGLADGVRQVQIAAGAIQDVQGDPIAAFSSEFILDRVGPRVISSSLQEGDVLPVGSLTYTVQFDEPLDAARVTAAAFTLRGLDLARTYTPTDFSFIQDTSVLTITYAGLSEDRYTLTLVSGGAAGLTDLAGNALDGEPPPGLWQIPPQRSGDGTPGGNFVVNFSTDADTSPFPTPLAAVAPAGSLIYQGQVQAVVAPAGDTDSFTLDLDAGQAVTLLVTPGATLRPTVELRGPSGDLLGSASAASAGQAALLQAVSAAKGGTYTVTVSGVGTTTGSYTARLILNAVLEAEGNGGPTNDTIATAQDLDPAFTALPGGAARAGVLGRTDGLPPPPVYSAAVATPAFEDIGTTGTILTGLQGADDDVQQITAAQLGGFTFSFYGTTYNTLWVSSNGLITFTGGDSSFTNTNLTTSPTLPTIAVFWDDLLIPDSAATGSVRFQVIGSGPAQHLVVQWTNVNFFDGGTSGITFQAVLNADGSIQFNYPDLIAGLPSADEGRSATVGVKAAGPQGPNRLLVHFNQPPSAFVGDGRSTQINPPPEGFPPPPAGPFAATAVTPVVFENIGTTGTVLTALTGVDDDFTSFTTTTSGFSFPFFGQTYSTFFVSSNGLITFGGGDASFTNTDLTTSPALPTIAVYWDDLLITGPQSNVRWQVLGSGATQHLVVQWSNVLYFAGSSTPTLTFQAVLNLDGSIQFNYQNLSGGVAGSDEGRSATVGVKAAGPQGPNRLLVHFNQPPSELVGNNRSTLLTPQAPPPPPPTRGDFYSVTLAEGQTVSVGATGANLQLELQDADGTVVAPSAAGVNVNRIINNFRATTAGTYYVRVAAADTVNYSLVVTRDADFDTESNSTSATAQNITGTGGALGHVTGGGSTAGARVLYFSDVSPAGPDPYLQALAALGITPTVVAQADTTSPQPAYSNFVTQLSAGGWDLVIFQQRFWFEATVVTPIVNYVNGGGRMIWSTWNRTQVFPAMAPVFTAFEATSTGGVNQTVVNQTVSSPIWDGIPNPLNLTLDGTIGTSTIGLQPTGGGTAVGRYANNEAALIVGNNGRTVFNGFMPYLINDAPSRQRLAQNEIGVVLGGITDDDWYRVDATDGQELVFETSTPADGPGEFVNTLDPHIELYGPDGTLVASGTVLEDGHNERIVFTVPEGGEGTYRIRVTAENGTRGEYFLGRVEAASAGGPSAAGFADAGNDGAALAALPTAVVSLDSSSSENGSVGARRSLDELAFAAASDLDSLPKSSFGADNLRAATDRLDAVLVALAQADQAPADNTQGPEAAFRKYAGAFEELVTTGLGLQRLDDGLIQLLAQGRAAARRS